MHASITPAPLTITPSPLALAYGDALPASTTAFQAVGLQGADAIAGVGLEVVGASAPWMFGSYDLRATNAVAAGGTSLANYDVTYAVAAGALTVDVGASTVTLSGATVTYDGEPHALTPTFDPPAAADGAVVEYRTSGGTLLAGPPVDAGSYVVTATAGPAFGGSATATLTVAPRDLAVTNVLWADKVYDAGTGATASADLVTANVVAGDDVALVAQLVGTFAGADVGSHAVTGAFALTGADAANYRVHPQPTGTASILLRPVALTGVSAAGKTYDGTTSAVVQGTLEPAAGFDRGLLSQHVANHGFNARFADAAAGTQAVVYELTGPRAANYRLEAPALSATIAPRTLTITPHADQSATYGDDEGPYGFDVSGLLGDDTVAGALGREGGADAGSYAFTLGSLDAGGNYALELATDAPTFTVTPRAITLTVANPTFEYGDTDLDLDAVLAAGSTLRQGDALTGALALTGTNVGQHAFSIGSASLERDGHDVSPNYSLSFADYLVEPRPATVTPDAGQHVTYGDADPVLTFSVSGLLGDDALLGALGREPGDAAGSYAFTLGTLANPNYALTLAGDAPTFTIGARTLTVGGSFSPASKPYDGGTDATLGSDELVLLNVVAGDDVSLVAVLAYDDAMVGDGITVRLVAGSSLAGADAANYTLSLDGAPTSDAGSIVKRTVGFEVTNRASLVYDGSRALSISVEATDLAPYDDNDLVIYSLQRHYAVDARGDAVVPQRWVNALDQAGTYVLTISSIDPRYTGTTIVSVVVQHRPIEIETLVASKVYGEADPDLTPVRTGGTLGQGDAIASLGALSYAGVDVGTYPLTLGSASIVRGGVDVSDNYAVTFGGFEITPRPLVITALGHVKTYGDDLDLGDAAFTVAGTSAPASGLVEGETVASVTLTSEGAAAGAPIGAYDVVPSAALGAEANAFAARNYAIDYVVGTLEVEARTVILGAVDAAWTYGDAPDLGVIDLSQAGDHDADGVAAIDALVGTLAVVDPSVAASGSAFARGSADLMRDDASVWGNYDVTFAAYDVAQRALTIRATDQADKTYGDALDLGTTAFTVDAATGFSDGLAGEERVTAVALSSDGAAVGASVGSYPIVASSASGTDGFDAANYAITYVDASLTVVARSVTVGATLGTAGKEYGDADPLIVPMALSGTLSPIDAFSGHLTFDGYGANQGVGTYALSVAGDFAIVREGDGAPADVTANYVLDFGTFRIDPKPVAFFIDNGDELIGDVTVFFADGATDVGLRTRSEPSGVATLSLNYRRTHDANHVPVPLAQQPVNEIRALGTYVVTMSIVDPATGQALDPNYVDAVPGGSVRTVWVTDATHVAISGASEGIVGATSPFTLELRGANGAPRVAGPAGIRVDLAVSPDVATVVSSGVAVDHLVIPAGASGVGAELSLDLVARSAVTVAASVPPLGQTGAGVTSFSVTPTAALQVTTPARTVVEGLDSDLITVALTGADGQPVVASGAYDVGLQAPAGVTFLAADGGSVVHSLTIPAGSSAASVRVRSTTAGNLTLGFTADPAYVGVSSTQQGITVLTAPKPSSLSANARPAGTSGSHTIAGTGFSSGATVDFGAGVSASVTSVTSTSITVTIAVDTGAALGARTLTVTNPDGGVGTLANALTVQSNPQVTSITPSAGDQGQSGIALQVHGSGFMSGATLTLSGSGVVVSNVQVVSPTLVTALVAVAADAQASLRSVTVANPDGRSATLSSAFEIRRVFTLDTCNVWVAAGSGGLGITEDVWSMAGLPVGAIIDFSFNAYGVPDRWFVEYPIGTHIYATGWRGNSSYNDNPLYPGGIVGPGAGEKLDLLTYSAVLGDQFLVRSEGAQAGTAWVYSLRARCP